MDHPQDSFIQQVQPPKEEFMQELPNKRDHIKFNMTGYAERDDDIIKGQKDAYKDVNSILASNSTNKFLMTKYLANRRP